jgi:hypothetical protein
MRWRVSLPAHEVLLLFPSSKGSFFENLLDLPLRFLINDVWGWLEKVRSMLGCFTVRGKKGSVEDVVELPGFRELQSICYM